MVTLTWRSNCTILAVMFEFANRVAERSPPLKFTSTASAFAMSMTLSESALTSSREYIEARLESLRGASAPRQKATTALEPGQARQSCSGTELAARGDGGSNGKPIAGW